MPASRIANLAALLLGLGYLAAGWEQSLGTVEMPGDGLFPTLVGLVFTVLGACAVVADSRFGKDRADTGLVFPRGGDLRRVLWVALALVWFAAFFRFLGFYLCAWVLLMVLLRILGPWEWPRIAGVSAALAALSYFLFAKLLGAPLPFGTIWG